MPCFKGLAVSIHAADGPLEEYSIQRQSKHGRITSYIAVPPAKVPENSRTNKPEQSTFAISITLLTPGLNVPYSTPPSTEDDPFPSPKTVGSLPSYSNDKGKNANFVGPYVPMTSSPNETVAAYIYFDGRQKEEVATLLRRSEETWVNSRWVAVPESEGGGLAEREFLFREVGLERYLNGLDLDGKDAAKAERRRQRDERRRRRRKEADVGMDMDEIDSKDSKSPKVKREDHKDAELSSDSDSDIEPPVPEAAGQIKVALFRVLASGEVKRGEYSPQFDAHDDDEDLECGGRPTNGTGANKGEIPVADIDHTTSFAKPKTLDPKSISTQTVTGIDGPDKPYAVFTFLYRGERQLQKMGILPSPKEEPTFAKSTGKRRSVQTDLSKLPPLKAGGTVGFSTFRDSNLSPTFEFGKFQKDGKPGADIDSDADSDEELPDKNDEPELKEEDPNLLSPEDAKSQGELAEGVRKIKLKRQHSAEPLNSPSPNIRKSPATSTPVSGNTPPNTATTPPNFTSGVSASNLTGDSAAIIGSPMKRHRSSLAGFEDEDTLRSQFGAGFGGSLGNVLGSIDKVPEIIPKEDEEI
ncbi:MAG: hypothetical protein M1829_001900 [Trizodia sp. TS-e1964]|nr:MAG: hypothetical protein M1829_001900 [Trizodia sp. TS-e1964]